MLVLCCGGGWHLSPWATLPCRAGRGRATVFVKFHVPVDVRLSKGPFVWLGPEALRGFCWWGCSGGVVLAVAFGSFGRLPASVASAIWKRTNEWRSLRAGGGQNREAIFRRIHPYSTITGIGRNSSEVGEVGESGGLGGYDLYPLSEARPRSQLVIGLPGG